MIEITHLIIEINDFMVKIKKSIIEINLPMVSDHQ